MSAYQDKLTHPKWQRRRLEVMAAADFKCTRCGESESQLHVHHEKYLEGYEPWDYPSDLLTCLCDTCHTLTHIGEAKIRAFIGQETPAPIYTGRAEMALQQIEECFHDKDVDSKWDAVKLIQYRSAIQAWLRQFPKMPEGTEK